MATLTPSSEDTRIYELCVLLPYPMQPKELSEVQNEVEKLFEEAGGKQVAKDVWGRRGLAYKIEGSTEGIFVVYYYDLLPEKMEEIEHALRIMPKVLRHMVVKPPKDYQVVEFSKKYEEWKQSEQSAVETRKKDQEEELRKKMIAKQQRQTKRAEPAPKKVVKEVTEKDEGKITAEIDKLISADELEL
jgi:small subunit ribosomal protein S6